MESPSNEKKNLFFPGREKQAGILTRATPSETQGGRFLFIYLKNTRQSPCWESEAGVPHKSAVGNWWQIRTLIPASARLVWAVSLDHFHTLRPCLPVHSVGMGTSSEKNAALLLTFSSCKERAGTHVLLWGWGRSLEVPPASHGREVPK